MEYGVQWISGGRIEITLSSRLVQQSVEHTKLWIPCQHDKRQFATCFTACINDHTRLKLARFGELGPDPVISPIHYIIHP